MESSSETIKLRDGTRVSLRPPTPADAAALLAFLRSLSPRSCRLGFVSPVHELEGSARWAADPDGTDHVGIVALDRRGTIVGHTACVRIYGLRAEVAVDVEDVHRHPGLEDALLRRLARDAERQGIRTLIAQVLLENQ